MEIGPILTLKLRRSPKHIMDEGMCVMSLNTLSLKGYVPKQDQDIGATHIKILAPKNFVSFVSKAAYVYLHFPKGKEL